MDITDRLGVDREAAVPLESQLARQIAHLIATEAVRVGDHLPPIRLLAGRLGLNLHTVRAAYRRLADQGLVEMTRGRGTVVKARSLAGLAAGRSALRSFTVGVILPALESFYAPVIEGINSAADEDPSRVVVGIADERLDTAETLVRRFVTAGVDGIIVVSQVLADLDVDAADMPPIVFADAPGSPAPSIVFDPEPVTEAADHLRRHGHERIAVITPPAHHPNVAPLVDALRRWQRRHRGAELAVEEVAGWLVEDGERAMSRQLAITPRPGGVLCLSDNLAAGAMRAIRQAGLSIGGDVAIAGYGDAPLASLLEPPLTTVRLPARELGRLAMETLLSMIGEEPAPRVAPLTGTLVIRDSCGPHGA